MDNCKAKSLDLSAFLAAKGEQLINIERDGKQCEFVFQKSEQLHESVRAFLYEEENGALTLIDARKLLRELKNLKFKIYTY